MCYGRNRYITYNMWTSLEMHAHELPSPVLQVRIPQENMFKLAASTNPSWHKALMEGTLEAVKTAMFQLRRCGQRKTSCRMRTGLDSFLDVFLHPVGSFQKKGTPNMDFRMLGRPTRGALKEDSKFIVCQPFEPLYQPDRNAI